MNFTQYLFPDRRQKRESIERPEEIELLAKELIDAGWVFEIECFPDTQIVNMDCCDNDNVLAGEIVRNGPEVPGTVDKLVLQAYEHWNRLGKPKAGTGKPLIEEDLA